MSNGLAARRCILVTGSTSGIGRALALALAALPSKPTVIAAGRRQSRLDDLKAQGLQTVSFDLSGDEDYITKGLRGIIESYPELDAVVLCAGIQYEFQLDQPKAFKTNDMIKEMHVNYFANVMAINAILPHFQKLAAEGVHTSLVPVTSGMIMCPVPWLATLKDTNVHVTELVPPLVESELHDKAGTTEALSKIWMPLADFISEAMPGLLSGENAVPVQQAAALYNKFREGDKNAIAENMLKVRRNGQVSFLKAV